MSAPQVVARPVPSFESNEALRQAMDDKAKFVHSDLYFRDGSHTLGVIEEKLAGLTGVAEGEALAYNSGMSATAAAIDCGLANAGREKPVLACANTTYSQTRRYVENFVRGHRAKVRDFSSGSFDRGGDSIENMLAKEPDVIFTETISNYMGVSVLDVKRFLAAVSELPSQPTVVLDNTLPLSTAMPLGEIIQEDDKVIVVESGTKSYSFNEELLGVGYSKNEEILGWLRRYRRTRGDLPGNLAQNFLAEQIPDSLSGFDERNRRLYRSAAQIAFILSERVAERPDLQLQIDHPLLPSHDNADIYANQYNSEGAPLLFVASDLIDQHELYDRVWSNPAVEEYAERGQSFGFGKARIIYDEFQPCVRISGGAEIDSEALGHACADALYGSN
jgi:cystathionine beta-lyase/cystathionine gamma-synthase